MSVRFETYPEMTESGDDLFCEIPASWDRLRIKQLFQIRKDIAGRLGYPVWSVTQHGLREKDITSGEGQLSMDYSKYQMLRVGDLVMNHMDLITGGVDIGWKEGVTSPDYRVFIPRRNAAVNKQFFVWLFRLCYWTKKFYSLGQGSAHLGRWRLPTRAFESIVVPVPPLAEQKQIASFLDYETAKIDALIEKQQQLIALLGEKRQAVISHAVTKGLNPDAPMRDSGIEWLGKVPEHWGVVPFKSFVTRFEQGWSPQCDQQMAEPDEWGVLKVGCCNTGTFDRTENKRLPKNLKPRPEYTLKKGDLLISRANTAELCGRAAVIQEDEPFLILCDKLYRVRVDATTSPDFVAHYLTTPAAREQIELGATGASPSMKNIGQDTIKKMRIPFPPLDEALEIVRDIERKTLALDAINAKAEREVELLQERRIALISAAVTGKIDVRGWKPPSADSQLEIEMEVA